ncbi:unnamed protein product [Bursaphelenchus xylophilus]|uniref:(pine wood nematode) hypothetical protein n=1 Tax=Bursaphelenchus xylophilus TaxID=6326 RepID=A0A1I7SLG6_BURXY|nr:unnamed protein product [Bursaphelenchus xylophilus]CAG9129581.1 unnamed protein product [Bursaphelenchus xylophilus]
MSLAGVLLNQLISLVRFVSSLCYRLINCVRYGRNSQRIGELPFITPADQRREFVGSSAYSNNGVQISNSQDSWNSWDDKAATTEQRIAEYRRQQLEKQKAAQIKQKDEEIDLFKELQPTVKEAKKYIIHDPNAQKAQQNVRKDLFSVQDIPTYGQAEKLSERR